LDFLSFGKSRHTFAKTITFAHFFLFQTNRVTNCSFVTLPEHACWWLVEIVSWTERKWFLRFKTSFIRYFGWLCINKVVNLQPFHSVWNSSWAERSKETMNPVNGWSNDNSRYEVQCIFNFFISIEAAYEQ